MSVLPVITPKLTVRCGGCKVEVSAYGFQELETVEAEHQAAGQPDCGDFEFTSENDHHRERAADMFGVAYEDVTNEQRHIAKVLGMGADYGVRGPADLVKLVNTDKVVKQIALNIDFGLLEAVMREAFVQQVTRRYLSP